MPTSPTLLAIGILPVGLASAFAALSLTLAWPTVSEAIPIDRARQEVLHIVYLFAELRSISEDGAYYES